MIGKKSNIKIAFYSFVASWLLFLFVLFSYFVAVGESSWWLTLFKVTILFIPLIVYLLALAFFVGVSIYFLLSFTQKQLLKSVEESVRVLANGQLDEPTIIEKSKEQLSDHPQVNIAHDLAQIRLQLQSLTRELQVLTARPLIIDGQTKEAILEMERHRLARELHDSVSQQLFAAMMMMSALNEQAEKSNFPEVQRKQLALVTTIINDSQSEMRALLLHLRPVNLEGKTLKQGIEQLLRELESKIKIGLKWRLEDLTLSSSIEDQLFRVVQELLSNTLRHAKAKSLEVYLTQIDQAVLLRIIDDGVGFDIEKKSNVGSYGLLNIKERIGSLGGTCKIISFKNQGTSIEIKVPLVGEIV